MKSYTREKLQEDLRRRKFSRNLAEMTCLAIHDVRSWPIADLWLRPLPTYCVEKLRYVDLWAEILTASTAQNDRYRTIMERLDV